MRGRGTDDPWFLELGTVAAHYRRPLRIDEVNLLAPTAEVRARPGRP